MKVLHNCNQGVLYITNKENYYSKVKNNLVKKENHRQPRQMRGKATWLFASPEDMYK